MSTTDISLIKDPTSPIFAQRTQPPSTAILVYFEGLLVLVELVERLNIGIHIKMGEPKDDPNISTGREGDATTSTLAVNFTSELLRHTLCPFTPYSFWLV